MPSASVIIPAHNEARVIGRLLSRLLAEASKDEFDVVVVANGCDDDTASVARGFGVRVVETPVPSKREALRLGDEAAAAHPRVYVDADIEMGTADLRALRDALLDGTADARDGMAHDSADDAHKTGTPGSADVARGGGAHGSADVTRGGGADGGTDHARGDRAGDGSEHGRSFAAPSRGTAPKALAAAPERALVLSDRPWPVRAYYAVWSRLPAVREGLFGRGVIAVSEEGNRRLMDLPPVMGDDLAASLAFEPAERRVVRHAHAVIHPPRTLGDLLRRRVRAVTVVAEIQQGPMSGQEARTGLRDLLAIAGRAPWLLPHLAVFLAVTLVARARARRAVRAKDYTTWLRDESSRT
ncbi:glycosyltransferase [Sphaerisporangium sp. NPDC005289]|uniref:glycosyltransferase n=1 Tax=Sphaerisporangium sp. NPDC005289 TaxID=3155247 RepID=UPI0033A1C9C0